MRSLLLVNFFFIAAYAFVYQEGGGVNRISRSNSQRLASSVEQTSIATPKLNYDLELWRKGFTDCKNEVCEYLNGSLPLDLVGTYYRNTPAKYTIGKEKVMHPFDPDGMISGITFKDGKAFFRNRFVRTNGFMNERKRRRILYRSVFATQPSGGFLSSMLRTKTKNVANTNVIHYAGRLLALWEAGNPHRLEDDSLRTIGKYTFKGMLGRDDAYTAHPKVDPVNGNLIGFGTTPGTKTTTLTVYEQDKDLQLVNKKVVELPGFCFFHDFAISKNYYMFLQTPCSFDPLPFVLGFKTPAQCISFKKDLPALLHLIPRRDGIAQEVIELDSQFIFHVSNGYEEDDSLFFDVVRSKDMKMTTENDAAKNVEAWNAIDIGDIPPTTLTRYEITKGSDGKRQWKSKDLFSAHSEFPTLNPAVIGKKNKYVFTLSVLNKSKSGPFNTLIKIDTTSTQYTEWMAQPEEFLGEPCFASRKGSESAQEQEQEEDDGYILIMTLNTKEMKSCLLIFDAKNISQGPLQRLELPTFLPHGLHGNFAPDVIADFDEVKRKFTAFSALDLKNWNEMEGGFSGLGIKYEIM